MKSLTLFILFLTFYADANGQSYAVINDKDGFVNIRKDKSIHSRIIGKIYNEGVFAYDEDEKSDWVKIYKRDLDSKDKQLTEGYIYKSRISPLLKFKRIKNIKYYNDSCVAINDSLQVIIRSRPFNPNTHKLTYAKSIPNKNMGTELVKIDGQHFWGTDGELPKRKISSVKMIKNGKSIIFPENAFDDLYEPNFKSLQIYIAGNDIIYIEMDNSDGAGAYSVIWIIKNSQYLKRYIDNINV